MGMSTCDTGVCGVQRRQLGPHWSNSQLAKALGPSLGPLQGYYSFLTCEPSLQALGDTFLLHF